MIQDSAMLVDLNISVWTAKKLDKKVSREVDDAKNTKSRGGNYNKNLMCGTQKLEQVQKKVTEIRAWHSANTLPWSDAGVRLHGCLSRLSEKLAGDDKQVFRDTLVGNAVEMCDLLAKLNATADAKLEQARQALEKALVGVTPDALRAHAPVRKNVKAQVDAILDMF